MLLLSSLLLLSCNGGYRITGSIATDMLNGKYVYVKGNRGDVQHILDSCIIEDSRFAMQGSVDSSFIASLFVGETPVVPFVLEPGNICIDITSDAVAITGTPLNNQLWELMSQKLAIEKQMDELERMEISLILDGCTAEAAASYVSASIDSVGTAMEQLMNGFIRENIDNVLAPCVFALMYSAVPVPLMNSNLEKLYNDAPEQFRNDAFVKRFYDVARENVRRMNNHTSFEQ